MTSDESTLTSQDVSPSTLVFSDRPERVVGQMTTEQFVDHWSEGPNSFLEDSPNAVMSYVGTGDEVCDRGDHTMTVNSRKWASRSRNSRPNLAEPALAWIWTPAMNAQLGLDPPAGDPNPPPAEHTSREGSTA